MPRRARATRRATGSCHGAGGGERIEHGVRGRRHRGVRRIAQCDEADPCAGNPAHVRPEPGQPAAVRDDRPQRAVGEHVQPYPYPYPPPCCDHAPVVAERSAGRRGRPAASRVATPHPVRRHGGYGGRRARIEGRREEIDPPRQIRHGREQPTHRGDRTVAEHRFDDERVTRRGRLRYPVIASSGGGP